MRFNLKNRPRIHEVTIKDKRISDDVIHTPRLPYAETYEEWFEEFEKELREILKEYYAFFRGGKARFRTADELVKEILGDE